MPYQSGRYLPPIATPIASTYRKDYTSQTVTPPKSFKYRSICSLPPITYSKYRMVETTKYRDEFQGKFGPAAMSAKPPPYEFPSKDAVGTSTYRSYFQTSVDPKEMTQPTSAGRKNNPHPRGMTNAFNFPNRGYWVWPHRLQPIKFE